jgi:hypothetical protein
VPGNGNEGTTVPEAEGTIDKHLRTSVLEVASQERIRPDRGVTIVARYEKSRERQGRASPSRKGRSKVPSHLSVGGGIARAHPPRQGRYDSSPVRSAGKRRGGHHRPGRDDRKYLRTSVLAVASQERIRPDRDVTIVARYEVPGSGKEGITVPEGTIEKQRNESTNNNIYYLGCYLPDS